MNKKNKIVSILLIVLLFITIGLLVFNKVYNLEPKVTKITYANKFNEDRSRKVSLKIKKYNRNPVYCKFILGDTESDWIKLEKGKCSYDVISDKYEVKIKYNTNRFVSYKAFFKIDDILGITFNHHKKYMAIGETYNLETYLDSVGDVDTTVKYESSDPNIVSVDENGNITAHNLGTVTITGTTSNKLTTSFETTTTNLLRAPTLNNSKKIVPCNSYSQEELKLLDEILASRVEEAGPGTRAAAVAVSRFLTLEFPYKVPYFYENGRIGTNGVDGEGRYYRKGLYLGKEKQNEIKKVMAGPSSWGCPLTNYEDNDYRTPNVRYPNGLDCSGYVSWILKNAGLDIGDIGAGFSSRYNYTEVGELNRNSYELLHSGKVKPGDLIGWDGHIAMIGAMTDTKIYVTESLLPGVIMDEYDYSNPRSKFYSRYDHIIDMSNQYNGDGNLRYMW
jgi:cell wall-associated NlpC family hydrolase